MAVFVLYQPLEAFGENLFVLHVVSTPTAQQHQLFDEAPYFLVVTY